MFRIEGNKLCLVAEKMWQKKRKLRERGGIWAWNFEDLEFWIEMSSRPFWYLNGKHDKLFLYGYEIDGNALAVVEEVTNLAIHLCNSNFIINLYHLDFFFFLGLFDNYNDKKGEI